MSQETPSKPEKPKQRRLRGPKRREKILEDTLGVFAERGYSATTMADLAEASGVTRTVLYYYFESKQTLFLAVLEAQATELLRRIVPVTMSDGDQETRLRAILDASLAFAEEDPRCWDVLFRPGDDEDAEVREARERIQAVSIASLTSVIADDLAETGLDPKGAASEVVAAGGFAALIAIVAWWRQHPQHTREDMMDLMFPFFWSGLGGMLSQSAR